MEIVVTDEERRKVLDAVTDLNRAEHISYMSLQMLANATQLKVTKVRLVVDDLVATRLLKKYNVSDKQIRPRYYYVLTDAALIFLARAESKGEVTV